MSYRAFLKDAYLERKASDKSFTHAVISERAELKSTGFFSWVLSGKRNITPALAKKFCKVFKLDRSESAFFELLVSYDQAKNNEERAKYFRKIVINKKSIINEATPDQYAYFKHWYVAVIREIIAIKPFKDDFKKLGHSLIPKISPTEARDAVDLLMRLKFIKKENDGTLTHIPQTIIVGEEWRSMAIVNYQGSLMKLGVDALENIPSEDRDISTVTVSCTQELFETYKERMKQLRQEFLELARNEESADKVYQFNLQLFPLSKHLHEDE